MDLKAKIGPFPAYVWGGIIGLVIVGYLYTRSSKAKITGASPSPAASNPLDGAFTPGTTSGGGGGGGSTSNPSGSLINNAVWLTQGVAYLTGRGNSPLAAQQALGRYLNGETLSAADAALVNVWIVKQGTPPESVMTPVGSTNTGAQNDAAGKVAAHASALADLAKFQASQRSYALQRYEQVRLPQTATTRAAVQNIDNAQLTVTKQIQDAQRRVAATA